MPNSTFALVKFASLGNDPVIAWLDGLEFWNEKVEKRCQEANNHLPLDLEVLFQEEFDLPLVSADTIKLLRKLLGDSNGIELRKIGYTSTSWRDPGTCTGKLNNLHLIRVQDGNLLKPLPIAFDPRVQFLLGLRVSPLP